MKIAIFIIAVLLGLVAARLLYLRYWLFNASDKQNLEAAIDTEIEKIMKRGVFQGIVVGVYKAGRNYIKGYGTVNQESSQRPNAETVFQIGSISKVLTALLLQRLCDEDIVSMDATLGELLGESMVLSPSVQTVTLRQLVTHTSGFARMPKPLWDKMTEMAGDDDLRRDPYSYLGPEYMFDYLASAKGKRKAGRFEYSNYGMGLLAHILEIVMGEDYESMVKEKVLLPFGMHHTAITLTPEMQAKLAQGYTEKGLPTSVFTFAALGGAGAYSSTAEDLLTFVQASVAETGLASQLFQTMSKPQFKGKTGIGWIQPTFADRFIGNRGVVSHNGRVGGYASYLAIEKKSGTGVVVLTNQAIVTIGTLGMILMRQVCTQSWASSTPSNKSM